MIARETPAGLGAAAAARPHYPHKRKTWTKAHLNGWRARI